MVYQQLTDRVGVFGEGVNVGIIRTSGDGAVLVDTGANEGNARKLLRWVRDELALDVRAILTTHAHADHFGGHEFVTRRTNGKVFAPEIEATIVQFPELQPALLFGGATPPAALRERFILARPCHVDDVIRGDHIEIDDVRIDVVPLPGHSPNQVGYRMDGVFFCADVVFPASAIEKYRIPYLYDLDRHMASMESASSVECDFVVPGHGAVERDIRPLRDLNRAIVEETTSAILANLDEPMPLDAVAEAVFTSMHVPIMGHVSYYLLRPTIAAYLSALEAGGRVEHVIKGKQSRWRRV